MPQLTAADLLAKLQGVPGDTPVEVLFPRDYDGLFPISTHDLLSVRPSIVERAIVAGAYTLVLRAENGEQS